MSEKINSAPEGRDKGGLESKYVWKAEGVPTDPEAVKAVEEWANAWGKYVEKCKVENQPVPPNEASEDLKELQQIEQDKEDALSKMIPGSKFYQGAVIWDGGSVELTTN